MRGSVPYTFSTIRYQAPQTASKNEQKYREGLSVANSDSDSDGHMQGDSRLEEFPGTSIQLNAISAKKANEI